MFKKAYNTLHSCHNFPAGSQQAARGARICETSIVLVAWLTKVWRLHTSGRKHNNPLALMTISLALGHQAMRYVEWNGQSLLQIIMVCRQSSKMLYLNQYFNLLSSEPWRNLHRNNIWPILFRPKSIEGCCGEWSMSSKICMLTRGKYAAF